MGHPCRWGSGEREGEPAKRKLPWTNAYIIRVLLSWDLIIWSLDRIFPHSSMKSGDWFPLGPAHKSL